MNPLREMKCQRRVWVGNRKIANESDISLQKKWRLLPISSSPPAPRKLSNWRIIIIIKAVKNNLGSNFREFDEDLLFLTTNRYAIQQTSVMLIIN